MAVLDSAFDYCVQCRTHVPPLLGKTSKIMSKHAFASEFLSYPNIPILNHRINKFYYCACEKVNL